MRRWLALLLFVPLVACDPIPTANTDMLTEEDQQVTVTQNFDFDIHVGHDHEKDGGDDPARNSPPRIQNPGPQFSVVGDQVVLPINVDDPDGNTVTCTLASAPGGLRIDSGTCIITGTISPSSPDRSPFSAMVIASDTKESTAIVFVWNVAPVA